MPNQCAAVGGCREFAASWAVKLWVTDDEKAAMNTQNSTMMRPIMNVGLRSSALTR